MQLTKLFDNFIAAGLRKIESRGVAVLLFIASEMIEAGITCAGAPRGLGINFGEVANHLFARAMHAVQIEPVESRLVLIRLARIVVPSQPPDELFDVTVAPHPYRKTREAGERLPGRAIFGARANITIQAMRVRPIRLRGHRLESFFFDQALGDLRSRGIEFVGSVRRLTQEHEGCFASE